ncbi:related to multidrug resistant protein [Phialocephala subalpina]|uniref:Related to multidrug resistant protein n=1 Tax=Phialocephala subalpina TaxID=576137 RepID=A0A1L7XHD4_9HELO|nr:related to multidrug resistant protein [Phialocephala subalpina]
MPPQPLDAMTVEAIPAELEMASIPAATTKQIDPFLVTFERPYDAENPLDWNTGRKWSVTDVLSATGFNRIMVSTIMAPALGTIAHELGMTPAESAMALSIYLLATAFGPLAIGPLSEIYGRQVVLHASSVWFLIWNIACGFANTKEILIASRFLAGFGASSIYALAGGVLGDVWRPEQRGRSLGIYLLIPLLGACVGEFERRENQIYQLNHSPGPIIGGFMAARTTWRWMFWSTSIFQVVMIIVSILTFRETYGPVILQRRAKKLRRETGNQQYYTEHERRDCEKSLGRILGRALSRPLRLLAFHPIIQVTALISGFNYGLLYIVLSTFSDLWIQQYHQKVEISGLHYIACSLGEMAASQIAGPLMDYLFRRRQARNANNASNGLYQLEFRIPLMFPGIIIAPIGLLLYGWSAQYLVHWAVVDIGMFIALFGGQLSDIPLTAYIIDSYPGHTSSAMAATRFVESLTAFLFPLFAPRMYQVLGYGWGNSMLAFVGLLIGVPAPFFLWKYGAKLRAKAISSY